MSKAIEQSASVVQIDAENLDLECIRLPSDYLRYSHLVADAKANLDELRAAVAVKKAEISQAIRVDPLKYGVVDEATKDKKPTEAAIEACILTQKSYKDAQMAVTDGVHAHDILQAVVNALEHKKRSLTLLVELHGMGYFSSPRMNQAGKTAVQEMTKTKVRRGKIEQD